MNRFIPLIFFWLWVSGCKISDADRCADDLVWDKTVRLCRAPASTDDTETLQESDADGGAIDSERDTDADAGIEETATFGTPCSNNDECTGEVDFCLLDPRNPGEDGICTLEDCGPSDCPDDFRCCDCSAQGADIACMPTADAATAELFGCTCS